MEINHTNNSKVTVIKLKGRFDANSVNTLKKKVNGLLKDKHLHMVIDLKEVDFIDSSGLGCLVACYRSAIKMGGDILLASLSDHVRSLIELTRLHRLFEIFDEPEEAVTSFERRISVN